MFSDIVLPEGVAKNEDWQEFIERVMSVGLKYGGEAAISEFTVHCEMCSNQPATVYCDQDKAHLCATCDQQHHSQTRLLMKHARLPLYHSPFQFGACRIHSSDRYECVCLECGELLCQLCLLVGSHADRSDHPIVSTIDAFRISLGPGSGFLSTAASEEGGFVDTIVKRTNVSETFFAVIKKRRQLLDALKQRHSLVVQAEGNHSAIQLALDKQLRSAIDSLDRMRRKRIEYLESLRRESLLLLTLVEWFQTFTVHARLSLPPSLWLSYFHRVGSGDRPFRSLLLPNQSVEPVEIVSDFMKTLPKWITSRIDVQGFIDVVPESLLNARPPAVVADASKRSNFEWVPPAVNSQFDVAAPELSPERLRKNRMTARLEELLTKPQDSSSPSKMVMPLPCIDKLVDDPVPLDNVHDFVMQTLAVLAESENRIPYLDFPDVPVVSDDTPVHSGINVLPPPTVTAVAPPPPMQQVDMGLKLRQVLQGGPRPFDNAVSVITAAPSTERQELIRTFAYLFKSPENASLLEELIKAICVSTVNKIEASSFLVSGISMLVPLTAAFSLTLFPQDSIFLDILLEDLVTKSIASSQTMTDLSTLAESSVSKFITQIAQPSSAIVFPRSIRFLLRTVHEACASRFSPQVSMGVVSGLFLARIVSPRLLFCSPKSGGEVQAPQIVTLMTRFFHRISGAAAEGQSMLSLDSSQMPMINSAISQTNGLMTRSVLSVPAEGLPILTGGLSPRSAAARIDRKLKEYGQTLNYS